MIDAIMANSRRPFRNEAARKSYRDYMAKGDPGETPFHDAYGQYKKRPRPSPPSSLRLSEHSELEAYPSATLSDVRSEQSAS